MAGARETETLGNLLVDSVSACFAFNDVLRSLFGVNMAGAGSKLVALFDLIVEEDLFLRC